MIVDHWEDRLFDLSPCQKDIYFSEAYCGLYDCAERKARAFIYEKDRSRYILPFMVGEIPTAGGLADFETPYGYGGPVTNDVDPAFLRSAEQSLVADCRREGIVAGFVRFHPVLDNAHLAGGAFSVFPDRKTVAMDVSVSEERLGPSSAFKKQKHDQEGRNAGLEFLWMRPLRTAEFKQLYAQTMRLLDADSFYYFADTYFDRLAIALAGKAFIGGISHGSQIVAAAIFLHEGPWGHYHLAGSDYEWARQGANNLLLYEAAVTLGNKGVRVFHLGGGTDQSPHNSLLAFKQRFSPNRYSFSIGRGVFLDDEYRRLCAEWSEQYPEKRERFGSMALKYRY